MPKQNRHKRKIRKGDQIIKKLADFEGAGADAKRLVYLRKIDPFVFEELLLSAFKNYGYEIQRNKRYTGDGGIDGKIYDKYGRLILVQAKRYKNTINPKHIDDFSEAIDRFCATKGYFVHTGRTGKKSIQTVLKYQGKIKIISGEHLLKLISKAA